MRAARARRQTSQDRAEEDQEEYETRGPELRHRLQVEAVGVDRVGRAGSAVVPQRLVRARAVTVERR